jgi:hypothetical protein
MYIFDKKTVPDTAKAKAYAIFKHHFENTTVIYR